MLDLTYMLVVRLAEKRRCDKGAEPPDCTSVSQLHGHLKTPFVSFVFAGKCYVATRPLPLLPRGFLEIVLSGRVPSTIVIVLGK